MGTLSGPYYRRNLALVHHKGFAFHAATCTPGVLELLEPVRRRRGLVVEIGCGSGLLTGALVKAGHRVIATDASPAMLELARDGIDGAEEIRRVTLPDDPLPAADAIVGVGHALNYLPDAVAVARALRAMARVLRPGGILAVDICDLEYGLARREAPDLARVEEDWAIVTRISTPSADSFVRQMTVFVRGDDGSWHRDDERHDNVLIDTSALPALLGSEGVEAEVRGAFGSEQLPVGLRALVGRRPA
jgi:SAM-dependent methyltransferase